MLGGGLLLAVERLPFGPIQGRCRLKGLRPARGRASSDVDGRLTTPSIPEGRQ
jgi:hypothetical protein